MHPDAEARSLTGRIGAMDAVRGFALLGILIVHMVEQYLASPPPPSEPDLGLLIPTDGVVRVVVALLFVGKFFALFSLLFGVSFVIQLDRAARRGLPFARRFAWRLAILFAFGMVHHLFYRGDILAIYAALGFLLLPLYRAGDRVLLWVAAALALGAHRVPLALHAWSTGGGVAIVPVDEAALNAYFAAVRSGSLTALFASNLTDGVTTKLYFQFGWMGRGWQTLALFVLGLYIGRRRLHERLTDLRQPLARLAWGGLAVSLAMPLLLALAFLGGITPASADDARPWHFFVALGMYDVFNLGVMAALGAGFLLLYTGRMHGALRPFEAVGRTALTTYVAQSAIGTAIYYGFGLGLLGRIPLTFAFLLGCVIFAGQMAASALWLRYFRSGPLEWLWRSLTDGRLPPLQRGGTSGALLPGANP